jgi:hypothetical protein
MSPVTCQSRPRVIYFHAAPPTMARKQCQVPVRNNYLRNLKRRVIHLSQNLHKGLAEIAILLDMSLRVIQCMRQVWNEIGEVSQQRARSGREPLMSREAVDVRLDQ